MEHWRVSLVLANSEARRFSPTVQELSVVERDPTSSSPLASDWRDEYDGMEEIKRTFRWKSTLAHAITANRLDDNPIRAVPVGNTPPIQAYIIEEFERDDWEDATEASDSGPVDTARAGRVSRVGRRKKWAN